MIEVEPVFRDICNGSILEMVGGLEGGLVVNQVTRVRFPVLKQREVISLILRFLQYRLCLLVINYIQSQKKSLHHLKQGSEMVLILSTGTYFYLEYLLVHIFIQ